MKVRQNDVKFLSIKIMMQEYVETTWIFLPIEITLKKYVVTSWKFIAILLSTYRRNTVIESTLIRRVDL